MLTEIECRDLGGPTNIYCSCACVHDGQSKLLIAVRSQLYCLSAVERLESSSSDMLPKMNVRWNLQSIQLYGIAPEAEIISVTCLPESISTSMNKGRTPVIALTSILGSEKTLHIYGSKNTREHGTVDLCTVFASHEECQTIRLDYFPTQLGHLTDSSPTFLVGGAIVDGNEVKGGNPVGSVHLYEYHPQQRIFVENKLEQEDEMMENLPSTPLSFDVKLIKSRRITAIGCQNGHTQLSVTDLSYQSQSILLDGPVPSVRIFETRTQKSFVSLDVPSQLGHNTVLSQLDTSVTAAVPLPLFSSGEELNLVVADATGRAIIFQDIAKELLKRPRVLPHSMDYDSITCIQLADVDFDGNYELLLGTYGQQVLVYREVDTDTVVVQNHLGDVRETREKEWKLCQRISLPAPVQSMVWTPLVRDGTNLLAVITVNAVHILQPELQKAKEKIIEVINIATELKELENKFQAINRRQEELKKQLE
ncbi:hypothetical protein PROFUN_11833 [Planoprotostelium fungivorum]|uniref:Uncharacterized protein n=1 Tax=Planoprotostelium fungivorum TaxID=1890364 RepID=A0A2P6N9A1_9EUKA|nr:hypothetical protein PROFUN_11833 [Planoprotostelium fungivorum]